MTRQGILKFSARVPPDTAIEDRLFLFSRVRVLKVANVTFATFDTFFKSLLSVYVCVCVCVCICESL